MFNSNAVHVPWSRQNLWLQCTLCCPFISKIQPNWTEKSVFQLFVQSSVPSPSYTRIISADGDLNEPPSSFLLPPHYCGLGAGFIPFRAIVNNKQCEMRGLFMSLVIHY